MAGQRKRKTKTDATQTKGEGATETKGPKTGTGGGKHHRAKKPPRTTPPPAARKNNKKKAGGRSPAHGNPHTTPYHTYPSTPGVTRGCTVQRKPHTTGSPLQGWRETDGARARGHTPQHPKEKSRVPEKRKPTHMHHEPQPGKADRSKNPYPSTHALHPTQLWRGYHRTQPGKRAPQTPARNDGAKANARTLDPSQEWQSHRGTQTPTQTPHDNGKPSVHSPGTEAARAMQPTWLKQIRRPGVRLHPKACAALGLEAERATPKHLGTPVPRTCMHALGTGYARTSCEPLGFRPKEGTCASRGADPPGETSTSRWGHSFLPVLPGAALLGATSQV